MTRWRSENELCEAFSAAAVRSGWDVYPEVGGWDVVLARPHTDPPGPPLTVGIQAKLGCSWRVLAQAVRPSDRGPDYRAVLTARGDAEFGSLCNELGIGYYTGDGAWPVVTARGVRREQGRTDPLVLPSVSGVGSPGTPHPAELTPWRERAIVLCRILLARGWLDGVDFDRLGVSRTNWLRSWIRRDGWSATPTGRTARYVIACAPDELPDERYDETTRAAVFTAWAARESWLIGLDRGDDS